MQETTTTDKKHSLSLKERETLILDGVLDVLGFDEETVRCQTALGALCIEGGSLHIAKFSAEEGVLAVKGRISALLYEDTGEDKGRNGFLSRLRRK